MAGMCNTFWGSHCCDKPAGHTDRGDPTHVCGLSDPQGVCSEAIAAPGLTHGDAMVRYRYQGAADADDDAGGWTGWGPAVLFTLRDL